MFRLESLCQLLTVRTEESVQSEAQMYLFSIANKSALMRLYSHAHLQFGFSFLTTSLKCPNH